MKSLSQNCYKHSLTALSLKLLAQYTPQYYFASQFCSALSSCTSNSFLLFTLRKPLPIHNRIDSGLIVYFLLVTFQSIPTTIPKRHGVIQPKPISYKGTYALSKSPTKPMSVPLARKPSKIAKIVVKNIQGR